jgi:hypothetical protein
VQRRKINPIPRIDSIGDELIHLIRSKQVLGMTTSVIEPEINIPLEVALNVPRPDTEVQK